MPPKGYTQKETGLFWNLGETKIDPATGKESSEDSAEKITQIWGEYIEGDSVGFSGEAVGRYKIKLEGFATEKSEYDSNLNNATVTVLGSTLLDEYFESESSPIPVGTNVWIEFAGTGRTRSGGNPLKRFNVHVKE